MWCRASRSLLGKTLSRSHGDHNRKDAVTQEGWVLSKLRFGPLTLTEQHEGHRVTLFLAAPPPTLKHSTHSYRLTGCSVNRKDRVQRHSTLPMPSSAESRTQQAVWRVRESPTMRKFTDSFMLAKSNSEILYLKLSSTSTACRSLLTLGNPNYSSGNYA
ncbi:hypothetical protein NQZ68_012276 [Dissostichus eleginoides]|nr:hypothetical protein NQZ68_012276 [Dissostichus eleginoides]